MLDLDDARWRSLRSTYTSGAIVATRLRALEQNDLSPPDRDMLFQELCHQYTATEAGYAAAPHLIRLALGRSAGESLELLTFAAHIGSCAQLASSHAVPPFL